MTKKQKQYTVKKQEGKYWVVAPSGARIVVPHTILKEARQIARIFNQTKRDEKTVKTFPSASVREARAGLIPSEETDGRNVADNVCQNCDGKFRDDQLEEITHGIWERVSPGELMPSGECPDCGSLCHPVDNTLTPFVAAAQKLVETVAATGGLVKFPNGTIAPAGEPDWIDLGDAVLAAQGLLAGRGVKVKLGTKRAHA
jgi:hypothetical protein